MLFYGRHARCFENIQIKEMKVKESKRSVKSLYWCSPLIDVRKRWVMLDGVFHGYLKGHPRPEGHEMGHLPSDRASPGSFSTLKVTNHSLDTLGF